MTPRSQTRSLGPKSQTLILCSCCLVSLAFGYVGLIFLTLSHRLLLFLPLTNDVIRGDSIIIQA